jgi:hypothetical protein
MFNFFYQLFTLSSRTINVLLLGQSAETLSSRCYRRRESFAFSGLYFLINVIAFKIYGEENHCRRAYYDIIKYIDQVDDFLLDYLIEEQPEPTIGFIDE